MTPDLREPLAGPPTAPPAVDPLRPSAPYLVLCLLGVTLLWAVAIAGRLVVLFHREVRRSMAMRAPAAGMER